MPQRLTFLVLGATGGTGKHFVAQALREGHPVRVLARTPGKLTPAKDLEIIQGSITDPIDTDKLVAGVDVVVAMLGDRALQQKAKIATAFVKELVPSMRKHKVNRFLYQAGGLSKPYGQKLSWLLWAIRNTIARGFIGQHKDNEAVMEYLATEAKDINWVVHRAGIGGDGASKGTLGRSATKFSVATHKDCAEYNYRTIMDDKAATHTAEFSSQEEVRGVVGLRSISNGLL